MEKRRAYSINRNIVECKEKYLQGCPSSWYSVLIETLWNVKEGTDRTGKVHEYSINRNIVECKAV